MRWALVLNSVPEKAVKAAGGIEELAVPELNLFIVDRRRSCPQASF
jgi:hypothetical protein